MTVLGASGYTQSAGQTDVNGTLLSPIVSINGGRLIGTGVIAGGTPVAPALTTVTVAGTLSPGDAGPGTLTVLGSLDLTGTLDEGISFSSFGVTDIVGGLTLGPNSVLDILMPPGFAVPVGTVLDIMNFASLSGNFGSISGLKFNSSEFWTVAYDTNDITLTASTPKVPSIVLLGTGLLVLLRRRLLAAA